MRVAFVLRKAALTCRTVNAATNPIDDGSRGADAGRTIGPDGILRC